MTTEELLALVATGVAQVTGRPASALTLDADLDALGLDSLQTLELVAWAEERLSIRVPDEQLARVGSIGELSAVLAAQLPAGRVAAQLLAGQVAGRLPAGSLPAGSLPAGSLPAGSLPVGSP